MTGLVLLYQPLPFSRAVHVAIASSTDNLVLCFFPTSLHFFHSARLLHYCWAGMSALPFGPASVPPPAQQGPGRSLSLQSKFFLQKIAARKFKSLKIELGGGKRERNEEVCYVKYECKSGSSLGNYKQMRRTNRRRRWSPLYPAHDLLRESFCPDVYLPHSCRQPVTGEWGHDASWLIGRCSHLSSKVDALQRMH